jgi:hypothetical protein
LQTHSMCKPILSCQMESSEVPSLVFHIGTSFAFGVQTLMWANLLWRNPWSMPYSVSMSTMKRNQVLTNHLHKVMISLYTEFA